VDSACDPASRDSIGIGGRRTRARTARQPRPADAAIAYIQSASQDPVSATSVTVNYAAAQNAGDLNVVVIGWANSTAQVNSVTDSKGNNYLVAVGPTTLAHVATQVIYYAPNIAAAAAGTNTVTVTFNSAVPYPDVRVFEYSGISTSNPFDVGVVPAASPAPAPTAARSPLATPTICWSAPTLSVTCLRRPAAATRCAWSPTRTATWWKIRR